MPTYDFKCDKCRKSFEIHVPIKDPHPEKCKCGGKLTKQFHPVGIIFKGSGFYATDSRDGCGSNGGKKSVAKPKKEECKEACASGACPAATSGESACSSAASSGSETCSSSACSAK